MTPLVKQQLIHQEKNLINMEQSSEFDSEAASSETEAIELSPVRARSAFNSDESDGGPDKINKDLQGKGAPLDDTNQAYDHRVEVRTQSEVTPRRVGPRPAANRLSRPPAPPPQTGLVKKRDTEIMMKQQTNVLIALNKSLAKRPSLRKAKAKRLEAKKETQRIIKAIFLTKNKHPKGAIKTKDEAAIIIQRHVRKRQ